MRVYMYAVTESKMKTKQKRDFFDVCAKYLLLQTLKYVQSQKTNISKVVGIDFYFYLQALIRNIGS